MTNVISALYFTPSPLTRTLPGGKPKAIGFLAFTQLKAKLLQWLQLTVRLHSLIVADRCWRARQYVACASRELAAHGPG
jgi:hypothetical protein